MEASAEFVVEPEWMSGGSGAYGSARVRGSDRIVTCAVRRSPRCGLIFRGPGSACGSATPDVRGSGRGGAEVVDPRRMLAGFGAACGPAPRASLA